MEETGDLAVFMILLSHTGITTFITLIDGIVLHGALIDLSSMVSILIMDMGFTATLIFMGEAFGTATDTPLTIPTGDHLIVLTTIGETIFAEIALTVLLTEGKLLELELEEQRSTHALKIITTEHLLA